MANIAKLMKQAMSMQKDLERVQTELVNRTIDFTSGGGMVVATARADGTLAKIKIDPKVVNPSDVDLLEDLILAAVDGALKAAKEVANQEMGKVTAGMRLPGM
jgi:DNA-binding YbaB/EbfC family protein